MGHVWNKFGNIPSRQGTPDSKKKQGTPKLLAELTTRKRREEELTGKRRDEELKGKRPAWGDPGRGRPFHPTRR
jgi:hypothetical protein